MTAMGAASVFLLWRSWGIKFRSSGSRWLHPVNRLGPSLCHNFQQEEEDWLYGNTAVVTFTPDVCQSHCTQKKPSAVQGLSWHAAPFPVGRVQPSFSFPRAQGFLPAGRVTSGPRFQQSPKALNAGHLAFLKWLQTAGT